MAPTTATHPLPYVCDRCGAIRWSRPDGYFVSYPMCGAGHGPMRRTTPAMATHGHETIDLGAEPEVRG